MWAIGSKLVAIAFTIVLCLTGYIFMAEAATAPEYDLVFDNAPCVFDDDVTLYVDTQTNDRAFMLFNDHLKIRSQYLTFYELNNSYEHEDVNLVTGQYCYATVPAQNATLDTITEINRFQLSSWNGTVTVQMPTQYSANRMELTFNSTDNATLMIRAVGLHAGDEYKVFVDGAASGWRWVNDQQYIEYNYTSDWSNHTVIFQFTGRPVEVPSQYLIVIEVMLCMGIFIAVVKEMILPLKKKNFSPNEITRALFKSVIFIVVGIGMVVVVFRMFVGV